MRNPSSNAPANYPDTSRTGYPLFYPIGGDGLPTGVPHLVYDGQTFADEIEVETYKLRAKARDENLERWREEWAAQTWDGPIPATSATIEDARFVRWWNDRRFGGDLNLWYVVFGGSNPEINRLITDSFPLPHDYDQEAYSGPARAVLADL